MSAILSPCGTYRYTLSRRIPCVLRWIKPALFIMLNPSTADATEDDPTIRKCIGFAKSWQHTDLTVVNLFALRATKPIELLKHPDPVGPDNDKHVAEQIEKHAQIGTIVVAWGANKLAQGRARAIAPLLKGAPVKALQITKDGSPWHPLYVRYDAELTDWQVPS